MATSDVNDVFGKEELLFAAVVTGTLEQYKDLLNSLGDVDVRGEKQRTLLYVAVGLGKVDWVEGLLEKGANPGLRDVEGVSVKELAKGMGEKYPENEDRLLISKLVHLVMKVRDSVAQGGCNTTSTCEDTGMEAVGHEMISDLSRKTMCEVMNDIQRKITTIDVKVNDIQSRMATIDTQSQEIGVSCNSIHYLNVREECVEAMMRKTRILRSDEGKVTKARRMYEKLYSRGDETACLLKFLKSHDDVSVVIGFDSVDIGGMKSRFTDHDGVERKGHLHDYFADFEEKKVYLEGGYGDEDFTIGCLAGALAQMSVCLAFNNGGRPYAKGDDVTERRMKNALKEAEEENRRNGDGLDGLCWFVQITLEEGLSWFIHNALRKETQSGKEIYLTSAVPLMIARDGSTDGTSRLQERFPLLLELFRDSVMPALLSKAQV